MMKKNMTYAQAKKVFASPALKTRSSEYPTRYNGKIPLTVKMLKTVNSELPIVVEPKPIKVEEGQEYPVWVNSHGAVAAVLPSGETLGIKPDEFEVIEWHG